MKAHESWKWYGYAGHFIGSRSCAYHLATRVGNYLISTVGHYTPAGRQVVPLGADDDSFFETMVFPCDGEDALDNPNITSWSELDRRHYADSRTAERGHYEMCWKYSNMAPEIVPSAIPEA